ncbi:MULTISPECIES: glycosyltransferase [Bacillaceae]|uniref:Glycosyl transferase n=1 Tax=Gottfriedia luciferensis TaxID=178774 RepID=A0ABX2ZQI2_9BACI|nr:MULTISPECIES: glycosyltransferase [Bacillaceae]ODG92000.1 glycosyl transferase [Gottfriedia luciferensis]PGZ87574.1 glycosyltransferase [Bacillus sp. AFS029533]
MKKNILFVIDSLHIAGAEKSLTTLLNLLNLEEYSVDLMLFAHGGEFEKLVPKDVNILPPLKYTKFTELSMTDSVINSLKKFKFDMLFSRLKYSFEIRRKNYSIAEEARIFWESVSNVIEKNEKVYDIAISYAQGIPTFYVADKVIAKEKYAWVNVSYHLTDHERNFQEPFYDQYKKIVAVSNSTREIFIKTFPSCSSKMEVIFDINNPEFINQMALSGDSYQDNFNGIKILTIGRLAQQKGYDLALEACKNLKEKGIDFRWYVLGMGPLQQEIEKYIEDHQLHTNFILLGVKSNPYPYIKDADLYVQTSKFEGFGLAIAEARMLNIPIVTTRFDAVYSQMIDGKNGLVVDMTAEGVTNGILKLITDNELKENIVKFLRVEKKGNVEELEKFYELIG